MVTHPSVAVAALKDITDLAQRDILVRYLNRTISAEVALMNLLVVIPSLQKIQAMLTHAIANSYGEETTPLMILSALATENQQGCNRIATMLKSGVDSDEPAASIEEGIAFCKRLFDWSVEQCAEASVALYSLGNPVILESATSEIVKFMHQSQLLGPDRRLLEIGCGIGRFQSALAADVLTITGIDVSANMIRAARKRCSGYENVFLHECSGHDLTMFAADSFDFVYAVDSFPYLCQSGMQLVETHFKEVRRVLRPGGDFLILEFSYRNDLAADRQDVKRLGSCGFEVLTHGSRPFSLWDGTAFHLRTLT